MDSKPVILARILFFYMNPAPDPIFCLLRIPKKESDFNFSLPQLALGLHVRLMNVQGEN
jgi:hypothetical protein